MTENQEEAVEAVATRPSSFNRIQFSTFVNGDQIVIRTDTGEEFAEVAQGLADSMEDALKAVNSLKQTVVALGVFTGDSAKAATKERAADSPPPSGGGDVPRCKHGVMDDLRGKGYKGDFYCTLKTDNWREKCKPVKL